MCAITPWEFEKDYSPAWRDVVRHFRWTPDLEELAKTYLRHMLQIPEGAVIPPFITVHECFAPLSAYARRVREVQEELRDLGVNATHVIMTSDEEDERWWDEVSAQGWLRINHTRENTEERFGDWGPWYMVVLDAVVQSLGVGFVGTDRSTFSIMARRRVIDWNGGVSRMVMWGRANADDH
ncbi:hypothetical protein A0H81_00084 [Grifola frondosa]|uniref:Uncharacterized protein n=1 Tax=Grifola frondosa TaxID=5627 RepID=A0A1C7MPS1_GRIFR|nr:hypothetical protein A0H81_00084 [Grifola frondosa]